LAQAEHALKAARQCSLPRQFARKLVVFGITRRDGARLVEETIHEKNIDGAWLDHCAAGGGNNERLGAAARPDRQDRTDDYRFRSRRRVRPLGPHGSAPHRQHLPGKPNVVAQNMPGAGSFTAAAHIYSAAPKDGTVMGIIARDAPLGPLTGSGRRALRRDQAHLARHADHRNQCLHRL
jgi:hypothetical protein